MRIEIIYDNTSEKGYKSGWGFSCLVGGKILFDTGEAAEPLFYNMNKLGVDTGAIEAVVISHDHWDHTGGLSGLLRKHPGMKVYGCSGFSDKFRAGVIREGGRLVEADSFLKVGEGVHVTGEIAGEYNGGYIAEQSLAVETVSGVVVITGCSHPGIVEVIERVKEMFSKAGVSAALGGFHLKDKDRKTIESIVKRIKYMGVEKVGPSHCTGKEARNLFEKSFGSGYMTIKAGTVIEDL